MELKQNNQVTEKKLVVGIDIVKRTHCACFVDVRERLLRKSFSVPQSRDGFELFYQCILNEGIRENGGHRRY